MIVYLIIRRIVLEGSVQAPYSGAELAKELFCQALTRLRGRPYLCSFSPQLRDTAAGGESRSPRIGLD